MKITLLLVFFALLMVCIQCSNKNTREQCQQSSGVSDVDLNKVYDHRVFEDDPKLKKFLFCGNKVNGLQNEKGEIIVEAVKEVFTGVLKKPGVTVDDFVKCGKNLETPEETAWAFSKCVTELML